ncbi:MAG: trypsin-like peptidase domain-containing protein [Clostridia bacterium]|nr:trypsin-like peptidase domain-containing protein [Clostridia bacterium]
MKDIKTYEDLCMVLEINQGYFYSVLNKIKNKKGYTKFSIPKKNGGAREILAPSPIIKSLQLKIKAYIEGKYFPHTCAKGFKKGCCNVDNAKMHVKRNWCLNLDLKDFFPSINFGRVYGLLMSEPFNANKKIAVALAHILCYDNELPQGAPSSPLISNLIAYSLDNKLLALAKEYHCNYSRYADDISFSSNSTHMPKQLVVFDDLIHEWIIGDDLQNTIESCGFSINHGKTRLLKKNQRQEVTGIIVNSKLNLNRKYYREIRSIFHKIKVNGIKEVAKQNHERYGKCKDNSEFGLISFINGKLAYYKSVVGEDNPCYNKLCKLYNNTIEYKYKNCKSSKQELIDNAMFIIETSEGQGTAFLLKDLGLVTCKHCLGFKHDDFCTEEELIIFNKQNEDIIYAYRVSNPENRFKLKLKKIFKESDLAILELLTDEILQYYFYPSKERLDIHSKNCTLLGFPNHSKGSSISEINNIQVSSKKAYFGRDYYCLDKPIITGNSGGPLLNEQNEVLGIACKGAGDITSASETDFNGVIPIELLYTEKDA